MDLSGFALRRPHAVAVFALALLIFGSVVATRMGVDLLPTFRTPAVQILTFYPGMPAEIVEQDMTSRLERWTGQANGVARQESRSLVGVSVVKDYFRSDIDPNTALSMVSSLAMSDLYYLPPGTIPPMVMPFDPTASLPLALITVSSPNADEARLYDIAYFQLRNRLQGIQGVIAPAVFGGKLRRILAYLDPQKLQARGLGPLDVVDAMRHANVLVPTGSAKFGDLDYQIDAQGMVEKVKELGEIPLRMDADGRAVLLRDVAEPKDTAAIQTNIARVDGRRQVYIPIYRQPGANTLEIVDAIRSQLAEIQSHLPPGIHLDLVMDQSVYVRRAIRDLALEGGIGAAMAALMILLFLGQLRATLLVLLALPLAIVGALLGLGALGQTINAMTLGGLALSVGLLIDQAIVVTENIERHLAMGKTKLAAAQDGAREVQGPLLVITAVILAVFLPVLLLTGMGKLLFSALALAVGCAMIASYLLALTLVPALSVRILRARGERKPNRLVGLLQSGYLALLDLCFRQRTLTLLFALGISASALLLLPQIGREFFPPVDAGQLTVKLRAQSGLRLERTEELVITAEKTIAQVIPQNERIKVISNLGVLLDWPAAYTPNAGSMDAFISIQLAETHELSSQMYADLLRKRLQTALPGVEVAIDTGNLVTAAVTMGLPSPIDVQIEGKDLTKGLLLAEQIRQRIAKVPGAVDVRVQQRGDQPLLRIDVERRKAAELGLTQEQVVKTIVTALNSSINFAPSFWIDHSNGNHYFLGAQYPESAIQSLETLQDMPLTGLHPGQVTQLRNVVTFRRDVAPTELNHVNIARVLDVYANVQGRDVAGVASDAEKAIADLHPENFTISMHGEVATMREALASLGWGLLLAVVLVYLVLIIQFRSFVLPLVVLVAAPLGSSGVLLALYLADLTLNIQSVMGVILLVGITVSYSVLYLDHADTLVLQGVSVLDSIRDAARVRLRPILMTSLAATLGMVPMALRPGEANQPLAVAIIGGLIASTLLKLFVVPVLYTLLKRPEVG